MKSTVIDQFQFQRFYLKKLLSNIEDAQLYQSSREDINSPGWILGHLCVEVVGLMKFMNVEYEPLTQSWQSYFGRGTSGQSAEFQPTKEELLTVFDDYYNRLVKAYSKMSEEELEGPHPSKFLEKVYRNLDGLIAHHLVTHLGVHIGNITVWKQTMGIEVNGV